MSKVPIIIQKILAATTRSSVGSVAVLQPGSIDSPQDWAPNVLWATASAAACVICS